MSTSDTFYFESAGDGSNDPLASEGMLSTLYEAGFTAEERDLVVAEAVGMALQIRQQESGLETYKAANSILGRLALSPSTSSEVAADTERPLAEVELIIQFWARLGVVRIRSRGLTEEPPASGSLVAPEAIVHLTGFFVRSDDSIADLLSVDPTVAAR